MQETAKLPSGERSRMQSNPRRRRKRGGDPNLSACVNWRPAALIPRTDPPKPKKVTRRSSVRCREKKTEHLPVSLLRFQGETKPEMARQFFHRGLTDCRFDHGESRSTAWEDRLGRKIGKIGPYVEAAPAPQAITILQTRHSLTTRLDKFTAILFELRARDRSVLTQSLIEYSPQWVSRDDLCPLHRIRSTRGWARPFALERNCLLR